MRERNISLGFMALLIILSFGCRNYQKNRKLEQFDKFISEVALNHKNYSSSDWNKADEKFNAFCAFFDEEKTASLLTADEKGKYSNLKGRYKGMKLKSKMNKKLDEALQGLKETGLELKGILEGLNE